MTQPVGLKNVTWRIEQFRAADSPGFCLSLARALVASKILNQRKMLMRNHVNPSRDVLKFLKQLAIDSQRTADSQKLLGLEGSAARAYFENFAGMLKNGNRFRLPESDGSSESRKPSGFDFQRRNRRPPRDPVNAMLSLGYSLLSKELVIACAGIGLDPYLGFYHRPRAGRASLALDMMEPFRPLIVDSAVLTVINNRVIEPGDFVRAGYAVNLTPGGRKKFIEAFERRMKQEITHPLFGYRVSYRRILEIQARLLARVLMGEIKQFPLFTTR